MSEKATLLTSIPPVKKTESNDGRTSQLSSTQAESKNDGKVSLLSQTRDAPSASKPIEARQPASVATTGTEAVETVASESVAEEPNTITAFQMVTYASFVLNFLLAGAAAVILFKKAAKLVEERFVVSAKTLGIAAVLIMLHGFFATYLYAAHLNDTVSSAPLFLTMAVWVLIGPAVGFITRNLLARKEKPNRKAAFIDAGIYGLIFFLTACGVSSGINTNHTNAALLSSIMAGFLMIVPIARSLTAFNVAKARHKELNEASDQVLIYGLLILPALLPVLAFAHVCGLGDAVTLFLINFITFDFVLIVGLSMIASADQFIPEEAEQVTAEEAEPEPVAVEEAPLEAPAPAAAAAVKEAPPAAKAKPEKVATGNPNDPIIQFLNGEIDEDETPAAPAKPAANASPRAAPPRKPGSPVTPPKKPGSAPVADQASNTPSRLKAPAKPKKRF